MSEELYQCFEDLIDLNLPRIIHRQNLSMWITASTSHLMKRLQTQQQLHVQSPRATAKTCRDFKSCRD